MQVSQHALTGCVVRLAHGADEALVALEGGHVVAWRHDGRDMLWCSTTRFPGKPLRGGIPVCWPWFGAHPTDATKPAHGVARTGTWEVIEQGIAHVSMRFQHEELLARLDVKLGADLRVSLTTRNDGAVTLPVSAALHTYLAVDDIAEVSVSGLDDAAYIDTLDGWTRKVQQGDVIFDLEVDRIYSAGAARLNDGSRTVDVDSAGTSRSLVVWNPWVEKSARLGDMAEGAYRHMLCLETAWAGDDARRLAPASEATLTTILRPGATTR